jgi:hypothetical protein
MAKNSSRRSDAPEPLVRELSTLQKHWGLLSRELQTLLTLRPHDVTISHDIVGDTAAAGIEGHASMRARRDQGPPAAVVPLCDVGSEGLAVWAGFQEHWRSTTAKRFAFHHAGITVYLGRRNAAEKFQMFRAEWAGYIDRGSGPAFESPGAAHPHWQFDGIRHLSDGSATESRTVEDLRAKLLEEDMEKPFSAPQARSAFEAVRDFPVSRIHFALSASWATDGQHTRAPADEGEIRRWATACLRYIQAEMGKI